MAKRSPRYPRHSLPKALEFTKKLFTGAHRAKVDVDTAARVIGYSSSKGGAAASAIGAMRQFGLVDGLRGDLGVSDLAMRILQPLNREEEIEALHEAAAHPEIFEKISRQYPDGLPMSDEPIRAFLIRNEGFSVIGADELLETFRETFESLPADTNDLQERANIQAGKPTSESTSRLEIDSDAPQDSHSTSSNQASSETISIPLGALTRAEVRFFGDVTPSAYSRLIRHLELLRDVLAEDEA